MPGACYPAIMVNGAVTKHFKVLGGMTVLGLWIIEGISHRRPIERKLLSSVHHLRKRQTHCFQHGRGNIYAVIKLWPDLTFSLDSSGPMHAHSGAGTAAM